MRGVWTAPPLFRVKVDCTPTGPWTAPPPAQGAPPRRRCWPWAEPLQRSHRWAMRPWGHGEPRSLKQIAFPMVPPSKSLRKASSLRKAGKQPAQEWQAACARLASNQAGEKRKDEGWQAGFLMVCGYTPCLQQEKCVQEGTCGGRSVGPDRRPPSCRLPCITLAVYSRRAAQR